MHKREVQNEVANISRRAAKKIKSEMDPQTPHDTG